MTERPIEIVHIGSASRDLTSEDTRGWKLGGGSPYSALATARLGLRTAALVGVDAAAASAEELDLLRDAGVELVLQRLNTGPVFRNRELPGGRVQDCLVAGSPLPVPDLPGTWQEAAAWLLEPVAGELEEGWAGQLPPGALVGLGWQGLLRELVAGQVVRRRPPGPSRLLGRADLVGVSRHDLGPAATVAGLLGTLRPGALLAWTDGASGGRLARIGAGGRVQTQPWAAVSPAALVDPTGAGDVFLAALAASMVRPDMTGRTVGGRRAPDLEFAAAAASFVVEVPGLRGVPGLAEVLARLGRRATSGLPGG